MQLLANDIFFILMKVAGLVATSSLYDRSCGFEDFVWK